MEPRREPGDDAGRTDWLEVGPRRRPPGAPRRSWLWWVAAAILVAAAVSATRTGGDRLGSPQPAPTQQAATTRARNPESTVRPPPSQPTVIALGHPLLGITGGYHLYARGKDQLIHIQPAQGRIFLTPLPGLTSGGPVFLLVDRTGALIRPLDFVAGYRVTDRQQVSELSGVLGNSGPMLPGPSPELVWVSSGTTGTYAMNLIDTDTSSVRRQVTLGDWSPQQLRTDGAGGLLQLRDDGVWQARSSTFTKVSDGALLAVGAGRLLTGRCRDGTCRLRLDEAGRQRVLGVAPDPESVDGLISPDGRYAALLEATDDGNALRLLDLNNRRRVVRVPDVRPPWAAGSMVWAPDSRWLFLVTGDGVVRVLDPGTGRIVDLGVTLPASEQLAVRP